MKRTSHLLLLFNNIIVKTSLPSVHVRISVHHFILWFVFELEIEYPNHLWVVAIRERLLEYDEEIQTHPAVASTNNRLSRSGKERATDVEVGVVAARNF